jgi:nucleoside-diphosphate-sugar epimerase
MGILEKLKTEELRKIASYLGIKTVFKKKDIIEAIQQAGLNKRKLDKLIFNELEKREKKNQKNRDLKQQFPIQRSKNILILSDSEDIFLQTVQSIENSPSKAFEGIIFHTHLVPEVGIRIIERLVKANEEVYVFITNYEFKTRIDTNYQTGLDTIREVKRRFPRIRTILLSESEIGRDKIEDAIDKKLIDGWIEQKSNDVGKEIVLKLETCIEDYENLFLRVSESLLGNNILITGATGYVGARFIKYLLKNTDAILYLLGRSKKGKTLAQRVGIEDKRVFYIEGDLTKPKIITNKKHLDLLTNVVEEVWHFAAITDFDETRWDDTIRVNLVGTVKLINILRKFKHLICYNHISTAYVVGEMYDPDEATETMPFPFNFRNPYEESKFYGESVVRNSGIPFRIFRPSMIVGDSITGESDTKTIYGAALMLFVAKMRYGKHQKIFTILGEKKAYKNIIPINTVVDLITGIRASDGGLYKTFALVNPERCTVGDIIDTIAELLQIKVKYDPSQDESKIDSEGDRFLFRSLQVFRKYMTLSDPKFTLSNTIKVLPDYDIPKPTKDLLRFLLGKFISEMIPRILQNQNKKS